MNPMEHKHNAETEMVGEEVVVVNQVEKKDRFLPITILVAAAIIGGSIVFSTLYKAPSTGSGQGGTGGTVQQQGTQPAAAAGDALKLGSRDAILGSANAPVTIVEYGDYQCPFCTKFFSDTEPQIVKNYVNSGKVKLVFRDFPFLGVESTAAANAAQCANDQGKLWAYHDALYSAKIGDEQKGGGENDGFFNRALFLKLAQQVGLNVSTFTGCVDGNKDANLVAQEKTTAAAAGVNSTPMFFVNGQQILGAQPYSQFQTVIDSALKG
jgi:protein-disulfide isomerase